MIPTFPNANEITQPSFLNQHTIYSLFYSFSLEESLIIVAAAIEFSVAMGKVELQTQGKDEKKPQMKKMKFDEFLFSHLGEIGKFQRIQVTFSPLFSSA